jgi:Lsr2 protein
MATIKIDDVTGSQTDVKPVKITFDGSQHTLDLSADSKAAFAAFLVDPVSGRAALVSLLAPAQATASPARRSGSGTRPSGESDGVKAKAWARTQPSLRDKVQDKGRAGKEIMDAWEKAGKPNPADAPAPAAS